MTKTSHIISSKNSSVKRTKHVHKKFNSLEYFQQPHYQRFVFSSSMQLAMFPCFSKLRLAHQVSACGRTTFPSSVSLTALPASASFIYIHSWYLTIPKSRLFFLAYVISRTSFVRNPEYSVETCCTCLSRSEAHWVMTIPAHQQASYSVFRTLITEWERRSKRIVLLSQGKRRVSSWQKRYHEGRLNSLTKLLFICTACPE